MRNLLVGNGINIQFEKKDYQPQQIVLRMLRNCERSDFPSHIIVDDPFLLKKYMGILYCEVEAMLRGDYDRFTTCSAEKNALISFKEHYTSIANTMKMTDIGLEDYYLIHDLICHKEGIHNPEQYTIRESIKMAYLLAIFNDGKLNDIHHQYPAGFVGFLHAFDQIFTTNYDSNIESATGKNVFHIHGQFDIKSEVYSPLSFRNMLPDAPLKDIDVDDNFYYLYSTAISTHCGEYKELQVKQYSSANQAVAKFAEAYLSDSNVKRDVESWLNDPNQIVSNLGHSIVLKAQNPDLGFPDYYHYEAFAGITDELVILGLSPWNDFHIFASIDQAKLSHCIYYYYNVNECDKIRELLNSQHKKGVLEFKSAKQLWEDCYAK